MNNNHGCAEIYRVEIIGMINFLSIASEGRSRYIATHHYSLYLLSYNEQVGVVENPEQR